MSIWNINVSKRKTTSLKQDINVDILIIGAGMSGLTTAYFLKGQKSLAVIDASTIGSGITKNSTAKITYLQDSIYSKIIKKTNKEKASLYLKSQIEGMNQLKNIIEKENIDCDLTKSPSYLFTMFKNVEYEKQITFFKKEKINIKKGELPFKTYQSYYVDDTYTFNPIKYLYGLANILTKENIPIYENSKIIKIKNNNNQFICYTPNNQITAKKVIIATNYPYFLKPFFTPFKCSLEKSHIIVSKVKNNLNFNCINFDNPSTSMRFYTNKNTHYQISLSQNHLIYFQQNDQDNFLKTQKTFQIKPNDIIMQYSNIDLLTYDSLPFVGEVSKNLYLMTGYNTWGMTNSAIAALLISSLVTNKKNKYQQLFDPLRFNKNKLLNLPLYTYYNIFSIILSKLYKNKSWYSKQVMFYTKDNLPLATYKDEHNKRHTIINRCPHLGCSLLFNEVEKTWDCPCHASRFDIDGKCIKGPSNYDISYPQINQEEKL